MLFLILLMLVAICAGVFGTFFVVLASALYRAVEALANGIVSGLFLTFRLFRAVITFAVRAGRATARYSRRKGVLLAQAAYAWWFGYHWRWKRRYIAGVLRARRASRHA